MPLVSVVMAAKNYARFLPVAVESVFAQTFRDWELLVVDDGSSDDTPNAVRPFLPDHRVRYLRSDRLGQPRAKNLGIGLSRGEFVAFLDADDAWEPTKLEKQLAVFRDKPEVGVVFCRRSLMDGKGNRLGGEAHPPPGTLRVPTSPSRGEVLSMTFPLEGEVAASAAPRRVGGGSAVSRKPVPTRNPLPRGRVLSQLFVQNFVCFSSA